MTTTFITGHPRCRSAWFTAYAIANGARSYNKPTDIFPPQYLLDLLEPGDLDLVLTGPDLLKLYPTLQPKGNWIIITRQNSPKCAAMDAAILGGALVVPFEELDDVKVLEQVHNIIFQGRVPFEPNSAMTLNLLNIQPHYGKYLERARNVEDITGGI